MPTWRVPPAADRDTGDWAILVHGKSSGRDEMLPLLTGVRLELEGSTVSLMATDRFRASLREFAGVLGHEVAHVGLRHSAQQLEDQRTANLGITAVCTLTGWCESGAAQVAIQVAGQAW